MAYTVSCVIFCNRSTLHAFVSRQKKRSPALFHPGSHINDRYLSTPERKRRLTSIRHRNKALQLKIERLKVKMEAVIEDQGVILDEATSTDLQQIMMEEEKQLGESLAQDSFKSIFWQQQKNAFGRKGNRCKGNRWHPLMIRFCLYLRHQSNKAYETLRNSGCIKLPSQRTLRDYSHCVKASAGYSAEEDSQLMNAANAGSCPKWHKLLILLIDEIHIKESLVYDKHSGEMIGFVDLGEVNNRLTAFERSIEINDKVPSLANSMLVIMARGLFTPLRFPYVQFPCLNISGELLFQPFWEAVYRLERMEFKV